MNSSIPTDGLVGWYEASDKRIVTDEKGRVMMWPDKSPSGRNPLTSPHYHPMQRIRKTWWPN